MQGSKTQRSEYLVMPLIAAGLLELICILILAMLVLFAVALKCYSGTSENHFSTRGLLSDILNVELSKTMIVK